MAVKKHTGGGATGNAMLVALWVTDPAGAAILVSGALSGVAGDVRQAAEFLHVGRSTLYRWIRTKEQLTRWRKILLHEAAAARRIALQGKEDEIS
jgi:Helix-turn-helix domain